MSAKITYEALTAYTTKILEKLGYPKPQAEVTAWVLVEADARGVPSHGVGRLPFYETNIKKKFVFPDFKRLSIFNLQSSILNNYSRSNGCHTFRPVPSCN